MVPARLHWPFDTKLARMYVRHCCLNPMLPHCIPRQKLQQAVAGEVVAPALELELAREPQAAQHHLANLGL